MSALAALFLLVLLRGNSVPLLAQPAVWSSAWLLGKVLSARSRISRVVGYPACAVALLFVSLGRMIGPS